RYRPHLRSLPTRRSSDLLVATAGGLVQGERGKKLRRWMLDRDLEGDAYDVVREVFSRSERYALVGAGVPAAAAVSPAAPEPLGLDRKSTRLNSSHVSISY